MLTIWGEIDELGKSVDEIGGEIALVRKNEK